MPPQVSIVKKKVTFPAKADVSAVIKSNRRMSQSDNNIGAQVRLCAWRCCFALRLLCDCLNATAHH
jgi:hypothetical protein